jgi:hypothetical protein
MLLPIEDEELAVLVVDDVAEFLASFFAHIVHSFEQRTHIHLALVDRKRFAI